MRTRRIRRSLAGSMLLLVAVASPASPQLRNLTATGYTGLAVPFGQFADYATVGASAGFTRLLSNGTEIMLDIGERLLRNLATGDGWDAITDLGLTPPVEA